MAVHAGSIDDRARRAAARRDRVEARLVLRVEAADGRGRVRDLLAIRRPVEAVDVMRGRGECARRAAAHRAHGEAGGGDGGVNVNDDRLFLRRRIGGEIRDALPVRRPLERARHALGRVGERTRRAAVDRNGHDLRHVVIDAEEREHRAVR